ncbi:MAG TPA: PP2C family serine/threonine-protein phosphatase [Gammaproteobacteria bacterium]|nr:PP2C family serine/threonine-protein phosphatase [Gammaproteobacteria bacterium]
MNVETAQVSRQGNRSDNQDRASVVVTDTRILLAVADGMGGHAAGDVAAESAIDSLVRAFKQVRGSIHDPAEFLRMSIIEAHEAVVLLGSSLPPEVRPRTTITACLIADNVACWAHVGDSRIYLIRDQHVLTRTRDHSAVEMLAQQGLVSEEALSRHPLRNFVDQCLGGDPELPTVTVAKPHPLLAGDVLLLCSDGLWAPLDDRYIASELGDNHLELQMALDVLAAEAESRASPSSDNVTGVALRWQD